MDKAMVQKGRMEDIDYFHQKEVYEKISRAEAKKRGIKVVKVRWIDINKGDEKVPKYRSRLVAKEFKEKGQDSENLFAGTHPLEAMKALVSEAATVQSAGNEENCMLIADVSRAFFEAHAKR